MKKLLLIGAMLIVGATSFSAVTEILTEGGTDPKYYSGTGRLPIESEGSILDPTGRVVLVLNAVDTAGTDGEALTFNFGAVGRGKQEVLAGKFQAKVLNGLKGDGTSEEVDLKSAVIDVKLERGGTKATAHKFTVNKTGSTTEKLVDLTYELSKANGLSVDGKAYDGEVIATAFRPTLAVDTNSEYKSGEFIDNSVSLVFDISNLRVN